MATKACFMVKVSGECYTNGCQDILRELAAMPEVKSVERVEGIGSLLVKVETPISMRVVADKILAKKGVKGLRILNIEPTKL